jgi:FkbM family methyltransferase
MLKNNYKHNLSKMLQLLNITNAHTALDIGANIGQSAKVLAQVAQQVVCYEPHPATFIKLQQNTKTLKNVTLVNAAVSNATTTAYITNNKNSCLNKLTSVSANATQINCVSDLQHQNVSIIKIDVEGHEPSVLQALHNILATQNAVIIIEERPNTQHAISTLLSKYDYVVAHTLKNNKNTNDVAYVKITQ